MLILLPPSEGKAVPRRGRPLDLDGLGFAPLTEARSAVLDALVDLCDVFGTDGTSGTDEPGLQRAVAVLGLGGTQADQVRLDARLREAPAARADRIYTGVLYDALDLASLDPSARRRAGARLAVQSALFGLLRPGDRIPSYRLSGDVTLPGLGKVAAHWRRHLDPVLPEVLGRGLLVDLRSSTYAAFWRPSADLAPRVATVRVLHEVDGTRKVVSHFNKATKGRIVRALLVDGGTPRTPAELATQLRDLGWTVEEGPAGRHGVQLDVVVTEV